MQKGSFSAKNIKWVPRNSDIKQFEPTLLFIVS
jgi:hypothetical protein